MSAVQTSSNQNSERKDLFSPHATLARKKRENRIPKIRRRKFFVKTESTFWLVFVSIRNVENVKDKTNYLDENVTDLLNNSVIQLFKNQHAKKRCFRHLFQKIEFCLNSAKISRFQELFDFPFSDFESGFRNVIVKCTRVGQFSRAFGISSLYGKPTFNLLKLTKLRKKISPN